MSVEPLTPQQYAEMNHNLGLLLGHYKQLDQVLQQRQAAVDEVNVAMNELRTNMGVMARRCEVKTLALTEDKYLSFSNLNPPQKVSKAVIVAVLSAFFMDSQNLPREEALERGEFLAKLIYAARQKKVPNRQLTPKTKKRKVSVKSEPENNY